MRPSFYFLPLMLCVIYVFLIQFFGINFTPHKMLRIININRREELSLFRLNCTEKFIVITTVQKPTTDIKRLAAEKQWTVVVVGDMKTPLEWYLPNVHYLSVEDQRALGYSVANTIPYGSYTRKMIGYLYAIERGAEWIYDTDDDNKPYGKGLSGFDYNKEKSGLIYRRGNSTTACSKLFQPYVHFGQPNIWPRGFPLQSISQCKNDGGVQLLCSKFNTPVIQQGIVQKDPDVDAIFRILNAGNDTGLNVIFSKHAPAVTLAPGIYSPFNSQNTLFHRSAFFTLWLPTSVAFRVTDIWRSYYAQKLIHLTGGTIAFYPVNAVQFRNPHNYFNDLKEEEKLYEDADRIVEFIDKWRCTSNETAICAIHLAADFAEEKFWNKSDVAVAQFWINDLLRLGYSFPPIKNNDLLKVYKADKSSRLDRNCRYVRMSFELTSGTPSELIERESNAINSYRELDDWCTELRINRSAYPEPTELFRAHSKTMFAEYREMALIITFNYWIGPSVAVLQRMYGPFFAVTIFCGQMKANLLYDLFDEFPKRQKFNYIDMSQNEMHLGFFAYYCTTVALKLGLQNVKGFAVQSDDTVFNMWNPFPINKFVIRRSNKIKDGSWWQSPFGSVALARVNEMLIASRYRSKDIDNILTRYEKAFEIEMVELFTVLTEFMFQASVFHEIAMAKIADGLQTHSDEKFSYLWGYEKRANWYGLYNESLLMLHPVKLQIIVRNESNHGQFCSLLDRFKRQIFNVT